MGDVKHYDPDMVDVLFTGIPLSGFGEDTFVSVELDEDDFIEVKGVDGDVSRSKVMARMGTITITIMSTSQSNAYLSGIRKGDLEAPGGAGVGAFMIRDRNGTTLVMAGKAWIAKPPPVVFGKQAVPLEWKLRAYNPEIFIGGT